MISEGPRPSFCALFLGAGFGVVIPALPALSQDSWANWACLDFAELCPKEVVSRRAFAGAWIWSSRRGSVAGSSRQRALLDLCGRVRIPSLEAWQGCLSICLPASWWTARARVADGTPAVCCCSFRQKFCGV